MLDKLPPSEAVEGQGIVLDSGLKTGQSLGRGWAAIIDGYIYTDSNDNIKDFEIQTPTPGEKNKNKNQLPIAYFTFYPTTSTAGQKITFNAAFSTDNDGQITYFIWDFGDESGTTTISTTTTHSYSIPSNFLVKLIVVDNNNATSSTITVINVGGVAVTGITLEPNELNLVVN